MKTFESIAFKMCSSHQSLDRDAFDTARGNGELFGVFACTCVSV